MKIGVVLLAAGKGSRMGKQPKALLRLQGVPLIERQLNALRKLGVDDIVVVTGFYHEQLEPVVRKLGVKIAHNVNPEVGQPHSVRIGIEKLGSQFDIVIMMLCDQPLVDADDIQSLIDAFEAREHGEILVPVVQTKRGNPTLFSGKTIGEILTQSPTMFCRKYMDLHPELVFSFQTSNEHFITDIDTLADIEAFEKKWHLHLETHFAQPDQQKPGKKIANRYQGQ